MTTPVKSVHAPVLGASRWTDPDTGSRVSGSVQPNGRRTVRMTTNMAVVRFPLGSFRATVDDGVVRGATLRSRLRNPCTAISSACTTRSTAYFAGDVDALDAIDGRGRRARRSSRRCGSGCARSRRARRSRTASSRARVGRPQAQRAVGMANASNPIALIVPCHRVDPHRRRARRLRVRPRLQALAARPRGARAGVARGPVASPVMAEPVRAPATASVTFRCHGHPRISGSHNKTVEFTRDADVTRPRDVRARGAQRPRRPRARALRGDVEVTVECGERARHVHARR